MDLLTVLLALFPVLVILILLIARRTPADVAGLGGITASLPIALVAATSIFQITIMLETGAIARVVAFIKTVAPNDKVVQIMLIKVGFGTLLTALGAVPVSILPPIMLALGYTTFAAIALPAIGLITLTGVAAGLGVIAAMLLYLKFTGRAVRDRSVLLEADLDAERRISLAAALSPWAILTVFSFLGLLGGFISGSEASSIAMLTDLHLSTADRIGAAGLLIAAASGIGGGLASVISPAKLQNAAAGIDRIGEESQVFRVTVVISLLITGAVALMTLMWAF